MVPVQITSLQESTVLPGIQAVPKSTILAARAMCESLLTAIGSEALFQTAGVAVAW